MSYSSSSYMIASSLYSSAAYNVMASPQADPVTSLPPYPVFDNARSQRIIDDVCDLLHDNKTSTQQKVARWLSHVMSIAATKRRWWFLDGLASKTIQPGTDIIDIKGQLDKVSSIFVYKQLDKVPLSRIIQGRARAARYNSLATAGIYPLEYALEAGRRVHLWPAPQLEVPFHVQFTRPFYVERLPAIWEPILINGIIGLYGRHFDRDALTADPQEFERRFYNQLSDPQLASDSHDIEHINRFQRDPQWPTANIPTSDKLGTAHEYVVPASLSGLGYDTLETGDYPITLQ